MFTQLRLDSLNKKAESPKNKPEEVVLNLNIEKGNIIADIGTGGGFFTFEFSKEVGDHGKIYAVDTDKNALSFITDKAKKSGIMNVKPILADEGLLLMPEKVDIFFLRNVFHHLPDRVGYFKNLIQFLKDDGKIFIIDYEKKGFGLMGIFGHYTSVEDEINIMEKAGFYVSD